MSARANLLPGNLPPSIPSSCSSPPPDPRGKATTTSVHSPSKKSKNLKSIDFLVSLPANSAIDPFHHPSSLVTPLLLPPPSHGARTHAHVHTHACIPVSLSLLRNQERKTTTSFTTSQHPPDIVVSAPLRTKTQHTRNPLLQAREEREKRHP